MASVFETGKTKTQAAAAPSGARSVFIDGEAGTVGLCIRERLAQLSAVRVESLPPALRKDPGAKRSLLGQVDVAILCLPDDAARETVAAIDALGEAGPRVLDASTAHRVAPGWTYGFPELLPGQADAIRASRRVTNPGCYPTGALALLRPLVDADVLPADHAVAIHAVSGYSGGGKGMIADFESGAAPSFKLYGLAFEHKHLPELHALSGLTRRPILVPSVGHFRQGMLVTIALHLDTLPGRPTKRDLEAILEERYRGSPRISVLPTEGSAPELEPEALNDTDALELRVYAHETHPHALLVARLDNLGKGAAGAAIQNLELMLGGEPVQP